ncbi:MAG: TetR/AcrR family transcriptional regulator [Spirochaetaceae bacterium]
MDKEERKQLEKEQAAEKRRIQILNAGKKLFSEKSPGEVTMAAIGRECALSPGTIYLYYVSKEDLLFHIMAEFLSGVILLYKIDEHLSGIQVVQKLITSLKDDYMINLPMKNLVAHFNLYYENEYPDLPIVSKFEKIANEINNNFENIIQKGIDDQTIRGDINPRLYGCLIGNLAGTFGSRTALRRKILTKNQKIDPFEEFCLALDLILNALKS